uniref:Uncharacterized protein n=1 Tax=Anopheles culicifacies TaxID=139723 RepID=A0A182MG50_9DIPT
MAYQLYQPFSPEIGSKQYGPTQRIQKGTEREKINMLDPTRQQLRLANRYKLCTIKAAGAGLLSSAGPSRYRPIPFTTRPPEAFALWKINLPYVLLIERQISINNVFHLKDSSRGKCRTLGKHRSERHSFVTPVPPVVTNSMTATVNPVIKVPVLEKPLNSVPVPVIGSAACNLQPGLC